MEFTTRIVELIDIEREKRASQIYPCHSNRASQLGHECLRYLVYSRTHWNKKAPITKEQQGLFDAGNIIEEYVLKQLKDSSIDVFEQQVSLSWQKYQITGHMDAMIRMPGASTDDTIPAEIKSISPWGFKGINTLQDMINSTKHWERKYPAQMQLYLLMKEKEQGVFLFCNKQNLAIKTVEVALDYGYAESIVQKAEKVNGFVIKVEETGDDALPERNVADHCEGCSFRHICIKSMNLGEGAELLPEEIEKLIDTKVAWDALHAEHSEVEKEAEDAWEKVREATKGKETWVGSKYMVLGKFDKKNTWRAKLVPLAGGGKEE